MKNLPTILLALLLTFLTSCLNKDMILNNSYQEEFLGYFASKYNDDIVFIGKEYHYVFNDESKEIKEFIKPEWKSKLGIARIELSVDKYNNVMGNVYLEFLQPKESISKEQLNLISNHGFKYPEYGNYSRKSIPLKGIRYKPAKTSYPIASGSFSKKHRTIIFYKIDPSDNLQKALLTPVVILADGTLMVLGEIFLPILNNVTK